jgi:Fur family ferric uptake transcriptional regulator
MKNPSTAVLKNTMPLKGQTGDPLKGPAKDPGAVFVEFLKTRNLKLTGQRRFILDIFIKAQSHISGEELYNLVVKKDKSIGLATVYRTLKLLYEAGIAGRMDFGGNVARYELVLGARHHDHLVCERCGAKVEVVDARIERLQESLAAAHGFVLTGHKMDLFGTCPKCRQKAAEVLSARGRAISRPHGKFNG